MPQDAAEAAKWYGKAAEQGDGDAQGYLGILYAQGSGVAQNLVLAYMWFNLAAIRGNESAIMARQIAADQMTPMQIAEAEKLTREWKPST